MKVVGVRHDWPEKAGFRIFRPRGHPTYTFLHFVTEVEIKIEDQIIRAQPGTCIFYAPGEPQYFYSSQELIHNWMHMDSDFSAVLNQYHIPQNCLLEPSNTAFISELFHKLEIEFFLDNPYKEELMESYVNAFVIQFARALENNVPTPVMNRQEWEKLRAVRYQVISSPEKRWSVAQMAELASSSQSRFHAVYKALFDTSPMQDLIEARVRYAKSLLLANAQCTLPEIAEKLGYNDQYHFIRQFRAITGTPPGTWRKAHK